MSQQQTTWMSMIRSKINIRSRYYIPCLYWLPNYNSADLIHDLLAGATVTCVLIPQGLSYAINLANLHPITGLYTSSFPVIMYGLFGTSKQLSIGPDALVSILVGSAIKQHIRLDDSLFSSTTIACTLCLLVGLITLALGFFRFGFLDSVLSRALLRGFISAIALVIMIEQIPSLLGLNLHSPTFLPPPSPLVLNHNHGAQMPHIEQQESPFDKWILICQLIGYTHVPTFLVSITSIAFLCLTRYMKSKVSRKSSKLLAVPEILVLVTLSIILSWIFQFNHTYNIKILGSIKSTGSKHFLTPKLPLLAPFTLLRSLFMPALLISILGFVESIAVTKQYASMHNYPVSRNRELVAFGIANIFGSFMGAYPAFGSLSRSRVNNNAGARTQLSAIISGLLVLCTIFWFLPFLFHLPKSVMSAVIFVAAISLLELEDVRFILKLRAWNDLGCLIFTFVVTLFVSIEAGILASIALSLMLVVKDVAMPKITILQYSTTAELDTEMPSRTVINTNAMTNIKWYTYKPNSDTSSNPSCNIPQFQPDSNPGPWSPFLNESNQLSDEDSSHDGNVTQSHTESVQLSDEEEDGSDDLKAVQPMLSDAGRRQLPTIPTMMTTCGAETSPTPSILVNLQSMIPLSELMVIVRIDESLHFANTGELRERLMRAEQFGSMEIHPSETPTRTHPLRLVIFQMRHMAHIDASAAQILKEIVVQYRHRKIGIALVSVRQSVWQVLVRADISCHVIAVSRISEAVSAFGLHRSSE